VRVKADIRIIMRKAFITIDSDDAEDLREVIRDLMCHWSPCNHDSDYCCAFCGSRTKTNIDHTIDHAKDCPAGRFLKLLDTEFDGGSED
jgi:hypothetical protein